MKRITLTVDVIEEDVEDLVEAASKLLPTWIIKVEEVDE